VVRVINLQATAQRLGLTFRIHLLEVGHTDQDRVLPPLLLKRLTRLLVSKP
jgi:hypothetical protein